MAGESMRTHPGPHPLHPLHALSRAGSQPRLGASRHARQKIESFSSSQISRVRRNMRNEKSASSDTISIQLNLPSSSMARERIE